MAARRISVGSGAIAADTEFDPAPAVDLGIERATAFRCLGDGGIPSRIRAILDAALKE